MYRGQLLASYGMAEALLCRPSRSLAIRAEGLAEVGILVVLDCLCLSNLVEDLEEVETVAAVESLCLSNLEVALEEVGIVADWLCLSSPVGDPAGVGTGCCCCCVLSSRGEGRGEAYTS